METQGIFRVRQKESSFEGSVQEQRIEVSREKPMTISADSNSYDLTFWILVGLSQAVGLLCVAFLVWWCILNGGFSVSNAQQLFYYHPLFMVLGLIFFYGDAIIVYRVLYFLPKWLLKWIHASLHLAAIVLSSLGLAAVFENHRRVNYADMYSLHSWIGIGACGAFCLQYIISFVSFLYPGLPGHLRAKVMSFHTFFGLGIFALAVAAALMGATEKLMWVYNKGNKSATVGNVLGLLIVVFAFFIAYISTRSNYKRPSRPGDAGSSVN